MPTRDPNRKCQGNKKRKNWADPNVPEPCGFYAEPDSRFCKWHGGTQNGANRINYVGGRKGFLSKLPERLAERIQEALDDPELTSLRPHIAVLEARIEEAYTKLWTKESLEAWHAIHEQQLEAAELATKLRAALPPDVLANEGFSQLYDRLQTCVGAIGHEFTHVDAERRAWEEAQPIVEQRRRLTETENKREAQLQANLTARQTMTLFATLHAIITEELRDYPDMRLRIGSRLGTLLLNRRPGTRALPQQVAETVEAEVLPPDDPPETAAASGSDT